MASKDKSELFEENIRLKQSVSNIKHSLDTVSVMTMDDIQTLGRGKRRWANIKARCRISPICTLVVIAVLTAAVAVYLLVGNYRLTKNASAVAAAAKATKATQWSGPQGCLSGTKQMFPDIDYALFGYNIIRGYPMAVGHDPGLTRPIFKADYNGKKHTADCKYSIPKGLTVVPDISCVTSFSSETIRDSYQLAKSLEASAEVSGGGWNAEFSASAEYKQKSNEVSSKESVYINSIAKCDYYLSIMDEVKPPPLDESFIEKAKTLKTKQDVFNFFEYYGTHYLKEVTFGARLIYESKMTNSDFSSLSEKSFSVSISASYDGVARVAGKASLSADEKKQAQEFRSKTQTKTISVGAPPPANGSTDDWASTVKDSPVPTKFKMGEIEELFSKKFMGGLVKDYDRLSKLIKTARAEYCKHLKDKGVVFDCKKLESYVYFKDVALKGKAFAVFTGTDHDVRKCIQVCMGEKECVAAVCHFHFGPLQPASQFAGLAR